MNKLQYYKPLDGVRGIAALMVMWFHFNWAGNSFLVRYISKTSVFGQTGVTLFFVLSGFLITRILLFKKGDTQHYFSNFYIRRSLRIFPLYFLFLGIYYFLVPLIYHLPNIPFGQQVYYWTYLQNFAQTFGWKAKGPDHFWSLAVEEHFYLFWPCLIYFCNLKQIKRTILILIGLALILRIVLIANGYPVFYWTFTNIDSLALGALLAVFEAENALMGKTNTAYVRAIAIGIFPLLIPMWLIFGGSENPVIQVIKPVLIFSAYYLLIFLVIRPQRNRWLKNFFARPFLTYTGKISYGLYVFHPLCYSIVATASLSRYLLVNLLISVAVSYAVATLSYYLFEKQFLNLKAKFE
ncbi:MAG TPA: acyltransferase [Puia sp.]|jgi:peptidoglycan/LPS O-acetylase OafA/YrhL|nr:acyltransferase [Puia sp.]